MNIHIITSKSGVSFFSFLLNYGVGVKIYDNPSVKKFLLKDLKIDEDYISNRIQTLFLNSKPIDNIDNAFLENGATLALSAAMPGTAGALFRKKGRYAAMRKQITYTDNIDIKKNKEGKIILKLFNMPAKELAGIIFERGVLIEKETLSLFLKNYNQRITPHIKEIHSDCKKKDKTIFFNRNLKAINLKVTFS
ncbi:MAG: hypothetical protein JRJ44_04225 [Deltaproteobacteria bacterium]|nr:hypothetical protein [Deltaproteobacteria bacterium]